MFAEKGLKNKLNVSVSSLFIKENLQKKKSWKNKKIRISFQVFGFSVMFFQKPVD